MSTLLPSQPSLSVLARQALERTILEGNYLPGERLVEERLCAELGISRPPLREALKAWRLERSRTDGVPAYVVFNDKTLDDGGLVAAVGLVLFSPVVSGTPTSLFPNADFAWFPLSNPGIVSIPLAFLLGIVGTLTSKDNENTEKAAEMEVRSLTGVGAEKAVKH